MATELEAQLIAQIDASGPITFDEFVEVALYDADRGFYATHGRAGGRRGDFVTSVEVGPLFGAVIADWLDGVWRELGQPMPFLVAEVGAGVGTLFRGVNRAAPACFEALTYTLIERSASMQVAHQSLPGEQWRSAGALPSQPQHVILANELLDNLAFGIAERVAEGWAPVVVAVADRQLNLEAGALDPHLDYLSDLAPAAAVGCRVPLAGAASRWLRQATQSAQRVLAFDYAASTADLAQRDQAGWLRTYAGHARGSNPLVEIGERDITHDVPFDQLPAPSHQSLQADWLNANGLPERVEAARELWAERGHIGDLQAVSARSAMNEAEALTYPAGLGAFVVFEWGRSAG